MENISDNIMFHYFHDSIKHPYIDGALTASDFERLLIRLLESKKLVSSTEWLDRFIASKLENKIALTFDDALLSQYDIAYPLMKRYGITGFWFVNTSPIKQVPIFMELFRRFKHEYFKDTNDYFNLFFQNYENKYKKSVSNEEVGNYLSSFPFYTFNDRKYRYIRDLLLTQNQYEELVKYMMQECGWFGDSYLNKIWLNAVQIKELAGDDNCIGLHSHTHPFNFKSLSKSDQFEEYEINQNIIQEVTGKKCTVMAHPVNSYSNDTFEVLKDLGVIYGFCSARKSGTYTNLELPRIDHTFIKY